jgi:hypothetical protein
VNGVAGGPVPGAGRDPGPDAIIAPMRAHDETIPPRGAGTAGRVPAAAAIGRLIGVLLPLLLAVALLAVPAARAQQPAPAPIGTVEQSAGRVLASLPGQPERALVKGARVFESDLVVTGPDGEAMIRMIDDAVLAVRPDTRFTFARYRFVARDRPAQSSSLVELARGALRTVTGLIGRTNPTGYQVRTTTATIGVRGTDHETLVLEHDSAEGSAGTYERVHSGATVVTDDQGQTIVVSAGQVAFAASTLIAGASRLGLLHQVPAMFRVGRYDNLLEAAGALLQRSLEQQLRQNLPGPLQQLVPRLPNLFGR